MSAAQRSPSQDAAGFGAPGPGRRAVSDRPPHDSPDRTRHDPADPAGPRILAVKLADFGDALLSTAALGVVRRALPVARIDVLTTPNGGVAYRHSGLVDDVMTFAKHAYDRPAGALAHPVGPLRLGRALRARRYDAVIFLHHLTTRFGAVKHAALALATGAPIRAGLARPGGRRGWFLTHPAVDLGYDRVPVLEANVAAAEALLAGLGVAPYAIAAANPPAARRPVFVPGSDADAAADRLLAELTALPRPYVAIHPGTGPFSPARRWPPDRFAGVADTLAAHDAQVVLVGTPADGTADVHAAIHAPVLDLTGRTDLPTLAAVLARMDLLVGNDSGVTHLAAAMGTPVVAVFGPSNPVAWGPWWPGVDASGRPAPSPHRVVALDLPCRPCFYVGHRLGSPQGCPSRDCLAWLSTERVLVATVATLAASGALGEGARTLVTRGAG